MTNDQREQYISYLKGLSDADLDIVVSSLQALTGVPAPAVGEEYIRVLDEDYEQLHAAMYVQGFRKDPRPPVFVAPYGDSFNWWLRGESFTNSYQIDAAKKAYGAGFKYAIMSVQKALDSKGIEVKLTQDPIPVDPPAPPVTPVD